MSGRELAPAGWTPARNARVTVLPYQDEDVPAGVWRVIDRAPDGWWITPADAGARAWRGRHPSRMVQGCLNVPGRRLAPAWLQLAVET